MAENIHINTYAGLKDYFNSSFILSFPEKITIEDLASELLKNRPDSLGLLNRCRFAVNQEIYGPEKIIGDLDTIDILPPSSGG